MQDDKIGNVSNKIFWLTLVLVSGFEIINLCNADFKSLPNEH